MSLTGLDWLIIIGFLLISLIIGLYFTRRAGKDLVSFFLSGRSLPWYIAGVSMVATTFAADTPLAVTEIVAQNGISGNWVWWNMLIGGMLTTFFFARYWRRSGVLTEVELISLRYGGPASKGLRLIKSVYLGLIMNAAVMAWVNLAFASLLIVFFDMSKETALLWVFGIALLIALYSTLAGLWGVAINDFIQFFIAMAGSIALAIFMLNSPEVGGIDGLRSALPDSSFAFFPQLEGNGSTLVVGLGSFVAFMGFQWWASWYPGAEPGGGGYIAQRMMSARSEKDSLLATLFFQFAHYCLRPWPWILVALAAMVVYPELADKKLGYVYAIRDFLPSGWKGLMLVAFLAAYMSTMSTQLNFGASFLVNDFIKPLDNRNRSHSYWVLIARICTLVLVIVSCFVSLHINSIKSVWSFVIECGAGLGLVLILRWYWWRINAWAEIAATITPFIVYSFANLVLAKYDPAWGYDLFTDPRTFFLTLGTTTFSWILVMSLTKPEKRSVIETFYGKVKPMGVWPSYLVNRSNKGILNLTGLWISAVIATYTALFSIGYSLFGFWDKLSVSLPVFVLSFGLFLILFRKSRFAES